MSVDDVTGGEEMTVVLTSHAVPRARLLPRSSGPVTAQVAWAGGSSTLGVRDLPCQRRLHGSLTAGLEHPDVGLSGERQRELDGDGGESVRGCLRHGLAQVEDTS